MTNAILISVAAILAGAIGAPVEAPAEIHREVLPMTPAQARLPVEGDMPSLAGATEWLNSPPLTTAVLRGKVVLASSALRTGGRLRCPSRTETRASARRAARGGRRVYAARGEGAALSIDRAKYRFTAGVEVAGSTPVSRSSSRARRGGAR